MKRYLVTGGYGFIGSNLVNKLLKSGNHVSIIDRRGISKAISNNKIVSDWHDATFTYKNSLHIYNEPIETALNNIKFNFDGVVHLAANPGVQLSIDNPRLDLDENLINTFNILEKMRLSDKKDYSFIFASSAAPLAGNTDFPLHNKLPLMPLSPYGASKAAAECYLNAYKNSYNTKATILRFSNIYGPGSLLKGSVVANMIKTGVDKGFIMINGDGQQTRDFVYIDDLVDSIIYALNCECSKLPIHICSSKPTSVIKLAEMVIASLKKYGNINVEVRHQKALNADAIINYSCNKYPVSLGYPLIRELSQDLIDKTVKAFLS